MAGAHARRTLASVAWDESRVPKVSGRMSNFLTISPLHCGTNRRLKTNQPFLSCLIEKLFTAHISYLARRVLGIWARNRERKHSIRRIGHHMNRLIKYLTLAAAVAGLAATARRFQPSRGGVSLSGGYILDQAIWATAHGFRALAVWSWRPHPTSEPIVGNSMGLLEKLTMNLHV